MQLTQHAALPTRTATLLATTIARGQTWQKGLMGVAITIAVRTARCCCRIAVIGKVLSKLVLHAPQLLRRGTVRQIAAKFEV